MQEAVDQVAQRLAAGQRLPAVVLEALETQVAELHQDPPLLLDHGAVVLRIAPQVQRPGLRLVLEQVAQGHEEHALRADQGVPDVVEALAVQQVLVQGREIAELLDPGGVALDVAEQAVAADIDAAVAVVGQGTGDVAIGQAQQLPAGAVEDQHAVVAGEVDDRGVILGDVEGLRVGFEVRGEAGDRRRTRGRRAGRSRRQQQGQPQAQRGNTAPGTAGTNVHVHPGAAPPRGAAQPDSEHRSLSYRFMSMHQGADSGARASATA